MSKKKPKKQPKKIKVDYRTVGLNGLGKTLISNGKKNPGYSVAVNTSGSVSKKDMAEFAKSGLMQELSQRLESAMMDLMHASSDMVSTQCPSCNLKLVIPRVESHRCVLCGCKELQKKPWDRNEQKNSGVLPPTT